MDVKEFNHILDDMIEHIQKTLLKKGHEYAGDADRLWNFKQAALLQSKTPEQALLGMASKHIISIYDMVNTYHVYTPLQWDEKIGDAINYLILLRALVVDTKRCYKDDLIEPFNNELNDALFNSLSVMMNDGTYCHSPNVTKKMDRVESELYCFWQDERRKKCDTCEFHVRKMHDGYNKEPKGIEMRDTSGKFTNYCLSPLTVDVQKHITNKLLKPENLKNIDYCYWGNKGPDAIKRHACYRCEFASQEPDKMVKPEAFK